MSDVLTDLHHEPSIRLREGNPKTNPGNLQPGCAADFLRLDLRPEHQARYERFHAEKIQASRRI